MEHNVDERLSELLKDYNYTASEAEKAEARKGEERKTRKENKKG